MAAVELVHLVAVYQQQLDYYTKMLALAKEQAQCLQDSNLPVFQEIIERRDRLQQEIVTLVTQSAELGKELQARLNIPEFNLTNLRKRLPEAEVAPLAKILGDLTDMIRSIQEQDENNTKQLTAAITANKLEAQQLNRARDAVRAYNPVLPTAARFVDKRK